MSDLTQDGLRVLLAESLFGVVHFHEAEMRCGIKPTFLMQLIEAEKREQRQS
jgi:hypothetical protein